MSSIHIRPFPPPTPILEKYWIMPLLLALNLKWRVHDFAKWRPLVWWAEDTGAFLGTGSLAGFSPLNHFPQASNVFILFERGTSRELLIASRIIAGAPQIDSPVVKLPLAHSLIFAGDTLLSPAHKQCIRQRYWLVGPQRLRRPLGIFIPDAYSPYAPGILDLPPANWARMRRG
jgi:hypothetical protein